ncbi:MAG: hypothetical protein CM1200mP2_23520 [Planctomycetaceae bacterium]|nr:MAG: hypothetical protein CM1200mP2_23520 [Planctomycetaceae bacterium]
MSQLRREVQAEVKLAGVLRVAALETAPGGRRALSRLNTYGNDITRSPRIVAKAAANRRSTTNGKKTGTESQARGCGSRRFSAGISPGAIGSAGPVDAESSPDKGRHQAFGNQRT